MIRDCAVAGQFYSGTSAGLMSEVSGLIEKASDKTRAKALVVPHAGLMYSGRVAGAAYSRIQMPKTFVILGPNHQGIGEDFSIMTSGVWATPMAQTTVDSELATLIYESCPHLTDDPLPHQYEHSIEVQLPFIQYLSDDAQIVPISMRHYPPKKSFLKICEEIGESIAEAVSKTSLDVVLVASTDFTHYMPQKVAAENDAAAVEAIKKLDGERLFKEIDARDISMCGYAPVAAVLAASRKMGASSAELVKYMTSGDVIGDYSSVVGYASLIIR